MKKISLVMNKRKEELNGALFSLLLSIIAFESLGLVESILYEKQKPSSVKTVIIFMKENGNDRNNRE